MKSPTPPHTYDEITRRTVPEPDSSFRPPIPHDSPDAIPLRKRVIEALRSSGFFDVGFEVDGERVLLRGEVRDLATRMRIEQLVAMIDGVDRVESTLHVVPRPGS